MKPIADGLGSAFLPYACGLLVIAVLTLAKILWDVVQKNAVTTAERERAHDAELAALQKSKEEEVKSLNAQLLAQAVSHAAAERKTLEQLLPMQAQLAEMIRLTEKE